MRRALFILWLTALAGGAGFYFGRRSVQQEREPAFARPPAIAPEPGQPASPEQSRTRLESAPAPAHIEPGGVTPDSGPLKDRRLAVPVAGIKRSDIQDTFEQTRGGERKHEATDIPAPRGTPVVAVMDGTIQKLFLSKPGGLTIYQFDAAEEYCFYYAHLDRYAPGLAEGMSVRRGQTIGYVGVTGNAPVDTPHLHFAIFQLGPEKKWWEGTPINPYPLLAR